MKIDILIPNFEDLGAQRVAINIANSLNKFHEIYFIVLENIGPFKQYINKDIQIFDLSNLIVNIPKIRVITKAVAYSKHVKRNKTDIAISFSPITNYYILYAKYRNSELKTIIQEHAYPSVALKDRGNSSLLNELFFKYILVNFYNKSDVFLTIANAIKNDFIKNFKTKKDFFEIVRNPLDIEKLLSLAQEPIDDFTFNKNTKYLISIGRLAYQKNFKMLIDIFLKVKNDYKGNIELIILGKGELEKDLINYSNSNELSNKIHFLGFKKNPYNYLAKSDIFCLTSKWEGLPQVIAESMICKTLVISHKCQSGPEEMIENNKTGYLIDYNDINKFSSKILETLSSDENTAIIEDAYLYASKEYSLSTAVTNYMKIIKKLK